MTFPYLQYGDFYRPIVPVTFMVGGQSLAYEALVDTGADYSVVDRELGRALGMSFEHAPAVEVAGIAGTTKGHIVPTDLAIGPLTFKQVPIIFADLGPRSLGILGHAGLFDRLRLVVEFSRREFQIIAVRSKQ